MLYLGIGLFFLDEKFNDSWRSECSSKNYMKKVHRLIKNVKGSTEPNLWSLLDSGLSILEKSCSQAPSTDLVAVKTLYLSEQVFKKFSLLLLDNELVRLCILFQNNILKYLILLNACLNTICIIQLSFWCI